MQLPAPARCCHVLVRTRLTNVFAVLNTSVHLCVHPCSDDQALCLATTAWFHLVVQLIVPLLYNVWRWQPVRSSSDTARDPSCSGLGGVLRWAAAASDRALHLALGGTAGWPVRLAVAYYILANAWLICRV